MTGPLKKTVLFVDDDEDDFLLLRDTFKERYTEAELQWAKDGEEAIEYLKRQGRFRGMPRPFLILLDLNMPKLNGQEVLKAVRGDDEIRHIPVVVLTNSMSKEEATEAYRSGVTSFIRKPSGYKELTEFVDVFTKYWFEYSTLI